MRKLILSIFILLFATNVAVYAKTDENVIDQNSIQEQNKLSDPKSIPEVSASDTIDDWAYSAINKFGIDEFGEHNGKFFFFASQSVSLKPVDPQFGDALVNAYDKALMKLQTKYLMARFGQIIVDKAKSFYSDRSTNTNTIELPNPRVTGFYTKLLKVLDKSLDVEDKKLDKQLVSLGVSPDELKKMTPEMKKDIFRDKFIKRSIRKASGSIAGLFPIQTALATDKKGNYVVGIIAVASPKTIQIAKDITLHRKSIIRGKGRDIKELLPSSPKAYIDTFGVRLAYDKDGTPMIISYGIGSYVLDSGDDYINDQYKQEAKENAKSNADAQIAEIVNGYMQVSQNRRNGEEIRKYVEREVKPNSDTIEKSIKNIIKITNNFVKSHARVSLKGVSTVKTWRYMLDKKIKFVGVVRVWKYSTLKAVKNFNNARYHAKKKKRKMHYQHTINSSKQVNDINDF